MPQCLMVCLSRATESPSIQHTQGNKPFDLSSYAVNHMACLWCGCQATM